GVHQRNSLLNRVIFLLQAPAAHIEHLWRQVEPCDGNASPRGRNEHTTGATADLEYRTARLRSGVDEERHIGSSPIGHHMVIQADNRLIRVITAVIAGTCQCALRSISWGQRHRLVSRRLSSTPLRAIASYRYRS